VIGSSDSQYLGFHSADTLTIKIDNSAPKDRKIETMLHEIIEAINVHTQLKLRHNQITTVSSILFQVLSDNGVNLSPLVKELK
jgi:hypothetical protein